MKSPTRDPLRPLHAGYVISLNESQSFADRAMISCISLRTSNPTAKLTVLCDDETFVKLESRRHRLLDVCDNVIPVPTPDGDSVLKHGWIKTRMNRYFNEDFIYLDADTLVRGSLENIFDFEGSVAGVLNHNADTSEWSVWANDFVFLEKIGSSRKCDNYVNGGVLAFRDGRVTDALFDAWHRVWCEGYYVTSNSQDRPALNLVLADLGPEKSVLSGDFNRQVSVSPDRHGQARVWHFKSSQLSGSWMSFLLDAATRMSLEQVQIAVRDVMARDAPRMDGQFRSFSSSNVEAFPSEGGRNLHDLVFVANVRRQKACTFANVLAWMGFRSRALAVLINALEADIATRVTPVIIEGLKAISDAIEPLDRTQAHIIREKLVALRKSQTV